MKPLVKYTWITTIIITTLLWLLCFHWTGIQEVGIRRNLITGQLSLDSIAGPEITPPWVQVSKIDTRPRRLCIECDCKNMNCILVSFNIQGWKEFVEREGFEYWWWSNRFSFNSGSNREYRGMDWILRGYTFDNTNYSFIIKEKTL